MVSASCSTLSVAGQTFVVQSLASADLPEMVALEHHAHAFPWPPQHFESSLTSHHCLGLRHKGDLVAHAILSFVVGEAELLLFVLDPAWRGKGVASAFLRELLRDASVRARILFLEVRASNTPAITLYEAVGLNQVGERPNYYPGKGSRRENALLYAIDL